MRKLWLVLGLLAVAAVTLMAADWQDNDFYLVHVNDQTKKATFDLSTLATGQISTIKLPALSSGSSYTGTLAFIDQPQTWTDNQTIDNGVAFTIGDDGITFDDPSSANNGGIGLAQPLTGTRIWGLPDITGTLLVTAGSQTITGVKTFDNTGGTGEPILLCDTGGPYGGIKFSDTGPTGTGFVADIQANSGMAADITVTLPSTTGTLANPANTMTFTNKRITQRVVSMTDATSFTPNASTADMNTQANTQATGTLTANAPSGTPTDGQVLIIRIKSTNVQTFAWNGIYRGGTTVPLPVTSTGSSKTDYYTFRYNSADSKWDCVVADYGY